MPSQYPRLYRDPVTGNNEVEETRFQGAKHCQLMLVSCTEYGGLHKVEGVLGHFVFAAEQPHPRRVTLRSIMRAFLGMVLLAAAVCVGAFGNEIITRPNKFFTLPAGVSAVPTPTPTTTAVAAPTTPIVATQEAQAPAIIATQWPPAPAAVSLEEGVGSAVKQIRAGLPRKIDALVTVVGVKNDGTTIIYENKIAMDGSKIDGTKKGKIHEQIIANTCNTPGPRKLLELGVAFRYLYIDIKEKPVMTTDVTKQACV